MTRPTHFAAERIYFADEVRFAAYLGALAGVLVTVAASALWAFVL